MIYCPIHEYSAPPRERLHPEPECRTCAGKVSASKGVKWLVSFSTVHGDMETDSYTWVLDDDLLEQFRALAPWTTIDSVSPWNPQ
jgi:hypothetical protein